MTQQLGGYPGAAVRVAPGARMPPMERHPNALQAAESAEVPLQKLSGYALNAEHPTGGHKARRVKAALGFVAKDSQMVADMIKSALSAHPAVDGPRNAWGATFYVDVPLTGPAGSAIVRTAWIIESGKEVPRMPSFYVKES